MKNHSQTDRSFVSIQEPVEEKRNFKRTNKLNINCTFVDYQPVIKKATFLLSHYAAALSDPSQVMRNSSISLRNENLPKTDLCNLSGLFSTGHSENTEASMNAFIMELRCFYK